MIVMELHAQCNVHEMVYVCLQVYVMELQSVWKRMRSLMKEVTYVTERTSEIEVSGSDFAYMNEKGVIRQEAH